MKRLQPAIVIAAFAVVLSGLTLSATPAAAASAPTAPTVFGLRTGVDYAEFSFTDASTNEDGFTIQTQVPGGAWQNGAEIRDHTSGQPEATGRTYTHSFQHLSVPVEICFRVAVFNESGTNYSRRPVCTAPHAVDNFKVVSKTSTSVTLSWRDDSINERSTDLYSGYASDHELDPVAHWGIQAGEGTITTYTVNGLRPNIVYEFAVFAANNVGDAESYHVTARTPAG